MSRVERLAISAPLSKIGKEPLFVKKRPDGVELILVDLLLKKSPFFLDRQGLLYKLDHKSIE